MNPARRVARRVGLLGALLVVATLTPSAAQAGCGCDKPPPPPAQMRPAVTYAGAPVTFFGPAFRVGQSYTVTFTSGTTSASATVSGVVANLRDLADGVYKPQLVVTLPALPLGPASIKVKPAGQAVIAASYDDSAFTVAPAPIAVPSQYGTWHYPSFQAAVGRDGTAYLALDVTGLQLPMVFEAQAAGYPLRFGAQNVLFKNTQGFLMQMLTGSKGNPTEPVPGMFVFPSSTSADSDVVHYSRHEFATYFVQHQERLPHQVDPSDGNWHLDGTRHVDHDHLILAITGTLGGKAPAPGTTPSFDLVTKTFSLFYQGLAGVDSVTVKSSAQTDGYDPTTWLFSATGDVYSNGPVMVANAAAVNGSAAGSSVTVDTTAKLTGAKTIVTTPTTFMAIKVPAAITDLGSINLTSTQSMTITGPGSFKVGDLTLGGQARLSIDNSKGPVTLYVTGSFTTNGTVVIATTDSNPEKFAIYVASSNAVQLGGSISGGFYGVIYAPTSALSIGGSTNFFGAYVGATASVGDSAKVHYDRLLRGNDTGGSTSVVASVLSLGKTPNAKASSAKTYR